MYSRDRRHARFVWTYLQTRFQSDRFRGVDAEVSAVHLINRGNQTSTQRRWLKRRQAIELVIGHVKQDHGMQRCWLKGQTGDALLAVLVRLDTTCAGCRAQSSARASALNFCSRVVVL